MNTSEIEEAKNYAAEEMNKFNSINKSYNLMLKILTIMSIFCLIGILILKNFFGLIFGQEWKDVGKIVLILTPFYLTKFISNPLSYTFFLSKKQEIDLIWQVGLLLNICFIFFLFDDFYRTLSVFTILISTYYLINLFLSYKLSKK